MNFGLEMWMTEDGLVLFQFFHDPHAVGPWYEAILLHARYEQVRGA
jgi:hypothetical protein